MTKLLTNITLLLLLPLMMYGKCNKKINVGTVSDTSMIEILQQISNLCKVSMFISDKATQTALNRKFKTLYFQSIDFEEAIKILLDRDFYYELDGNKLEISYFSTEILKLNYISLNRESKSSTKLTLDSSPKNTEGNDQSGSGGSSEVSISVSNKFYFWNDLRSDILKILAQDEIFNVKENIEDNLVINEKTGSIYVKSSKRQLEEIKKYIKSLNNNISKQVLVDINIYQVTLSNVHKTGIDWEQISEFQDFATSADIEASFSDTAQSSNKGSIKLTKDINIDNLLAFISTYGKTNSISNPRILAINNQTAIISIGKQIYYKIQSVTTTTKDVTTQSQDEEIDSIFAGIVVDVTPAISEENEIILKINNSITNVDSSSKNASSQNSAISRSIPPDIEKQEVSTVIKARNGEKIVIGGLMSDTSLDGTTGIKGLSTIPILGYFFGADTVNEVKKELVIVITPKVI